VNDPTLDGRQWLQAELYCQLLKDRMMLKSVKIAAILGLATVTTLAFLDSSAEAGRRRHRHHNDCCGNYGYSNYGGWNNGYASPCGQSPCGQSPCSNGACGVQQQPAGACNACGSTTMSPAPRTGYEYSAARPTYSDQNGQSQGQHDADQPTGEFDQDQYIRDQRLNSPAARNMTDEQILQQRNDQQNLNGAVRDQQREIRQDQRQLNRETNQTLQNTDRQLQNTNQQIQQNLNQNLNRVDQAVPDQITPPAVK